MVSGWVPSATFRDAMQGPGRAGCRYGLLHPRAVWDSTGPFLRTPARYAWLCSPRSGAALREAGRCLAPVVLYPRAGTRLSRRTAGQTTRSRRRALPTPAPTPPARSVETGWDDDFDGAIDEGCSCTPGDTQACHPDPSVAGVGACVLGTQTCEASGEFGAWSDCHDAGMPGEETCGDGIDEDCDGLVDEDCPTIVEVAVDLDGDCLTARCPDEAPYPVGCNIRMDGGDSRGCVGSSPTNPVVYFQEGMPAARGTSRARSAVRASRAPVSRKRPAASTSRRATTQPTGAVAPIRGVESRLLPGPRRHVVPHAPWPWCSPS